MTASDWFGAFKGPNVCTQRFSRVWLRLTLVREQGNLLVPEYGLETKTWSSKCQVGFLLRLSIQYILNSADSVYFSLSSPNLTVKTQ